MDLLTTIGEELLGLRSNTTFPAMTKATIPPRMFKPADNFCLFFPPEHCPLASMSAATPVLPIRFAVQVERSACARPLGACAPRCVDANPAVRVGVGRSARFVRRQIPHHLGRPGRHFGHPEFGAGRHEGTVNRGRAGGGAGHAVKDRSTAEPWPKPYTPVFIHRSIQKKKD